MRKKTTSASAFLVAALLLSLTTGYISRHISPGAMATLSAEKNIHKKQSELDAFMKYLYVNLSDLPELSDNKLQKYETSNELAAFVFEKDSLIYWSDNHIGTEEIRKVKSNTMAFLNNYWCICSVMDSGTTRITGIIRIRSAFPYENDYLKSRFSSFLKLPEDAGFSAEPKPGFEQIKDSTGNHLFSVKFNQENKIKSIFSGISLAMYFAVFFLFLYLIRTISLSINTSGARTVFLVFCTTCIIMLKLFMSMYKVPDIIYQLKLFSPQYCAISGFFPSLGDILFFSLAMVYLIYLFCHHINPDIKYIRRNVLRYLLAVLIILIPFIYFLFFVILFKNIVLNSGISLEIYRFNTLNIYSFAAFAVIAIHVAGLCFVIFKVKQMLPGFINKKVVFVFIICSAILIFTFCHLTGIIEWVSFCIIYIYILFRGTGSFLERNIDSFFILLLFSTLSMYIIHTSLKEKDNNHKKVLAVKLSAEHDLTAEALIEKISPGMKSDTILPGIIFDENFSYNTINNYLRENYFSGYWFKYDLQVTLCSPSDSVFIGSPENKWTHCYDFFNTMIQEDGTAIPSGFFYFINNFNGRINYIGQIEYSGNNGIVSLFIELRLRQIYEQLGYPELLLDSKALPSPLLKEYSYAKYYRNELITRHGNYPYPLTYNLPVGDRYEHFIYNVNDSSIIVISSPSVTFFLLFAGSSYIFLLFLSVFILLWIMKHIGLKDLSIQHSLTRKIQTALTLVLVFSFTIIAGGAIFFNIIQFQKKNSEILENKIQSIYTEFDQKFAFSNNLIDVKKGISKEDLDVLLVKWSDVFYVDINLYDVSGNLMSTSRNEIFHEGLLNSKMNIAALRYLKTTQTDKIILKENISQMQYLSAYIPFVNSNNKVLAYINLPYFTNTQNLKDEISNLVVAAMNIYVLLIIIALIIAVFISNTITRPLKIIQQRFANMKLGIRNEKIEYNANDEIGSLVKEYNRMSDELAHNIELLTRSEREAAWREMAKQVAHEIKNPLTPMKLNVQQIIKRWKEKDKDFEKYLEQFTKNMIGQIDNLSDIASAFSGFAQMPEANNKKINIIAVLDSAIEIFRNTDNITFVKQYEFEKEIAVTADKEYLSRVFVNIINNAIQSISAEKQGVIEVSVSIENKNVIIRIKDNGSGIPEDIHDKMFIPNFTTKTSGMGLGLAIARNTIESYGGTISFETEEGIGTSFIICMPL